MPSKLPLYKYQWSGSSSVSWCTMHSVLFTRNFKPIRKIIKKIELYHTFWRIMYPYHQNKLWRYSKNSWKIHFRIFISCVYTNLYGRYLSFYSTIVKITYISILSTVSPFVWEVGTRGIEVIKVIFSDIVIQRRWNF